MSSLKKFIVGGMMACASAVSMADTLYWQVADQSQPFSYAMVYKTTTPGSDGTAVAGALADGVTALESAQSGTKVSPITSDIGTDNSGYYFYVELFNYANESLGSVNKNYPWSYNELVSSGYISPTGGSIATPISAGALDGGAVPEPTSGMMLLIGASLLALRRRRA